MNLTDNLYTRTGNEIIEKEYNPSNEITGGSNFMFGNGYLGYRGTFMEDRSENYTGTIVTDTYDKADGKWRELCNIPNGLYVDITIDGKKLNYQNADNEYSERCISFKENIFYRKTSNTKGQLCVEKFADYDSLHSLALRADYEAHCAQEIMIQSGLDTNVWSINGNHFKSKELFQCDGHKGINIITKEFEIEVTVLESTYIYKQSANGLEEIVQKSEECEHELNNDLYCDTLKATLDEGDKLIIEKHVVIFTSNDTDHTIESCRMQIKNNLAAGYNSIKQNHLNAWDKSLNMYKIDISGDINAAACINFNIFHNIIHTPTHKLLPIGARGLSCQAYQGAAFWDQEIFNMPMYLNTNPDVAKNILKYRYKTMPKAKEKAKSLGYEGAFFSWISGKTGEELCPDFFFEDVLTGRKIRNHFNDWQIHISFDIGYSIVRYYIVTGDIEFLLEYGYEMLLEIGLFAISRSLYNFRKNRYEYIRLLGPDEYHENVDNNYFTNYQAKYLLTELLKINEQLSVNHHDRLKLIQDKVGADSKAFDQFEEVSKKIYLKEPNEKGIIEQFDGYFDLERIYPYKLRERLKNPLEYWGWPNGIAVYTGVIKQADIIQLLVLHDDFDKEIAKANYEYYEPITEHGSSLSPSMYSIIANRIGKHEEAYDYFIKGITVDLNDSNKSVSGGTFIGGIHTAAAGAVWQMIVYGFAGFKFDGKLIEFEPSLPKDWLSCEFRLDVRGHRLKCRFTMNSFEITGLSDGRSEISVSGQIKELVKDGHVIFDLADTIL